MKLKKRFKTVLGAVLAAAMVVTSVPITGGTVQAAQMDQTEEMTEEAIEKKTEETAESLSEETEQSSETEAEERQQRDEVKKESQASEETAEEKETASQTQREEIKLNAEETTAKIEGKTVTFTWVPSDDFFAYWDNENVYLAASDIDRIIVKGVEGGEGDWSQLAELTRSTDDVWTGTATLLPGKYVYKFFAYRPDNENGEHYEVGDNREFTIDGMSNTKITVVKNVEFSLPAALDGYKNGEAAEVSVLYDLSSESSQYSNDVELTGDTGSQKLTVKDTLDENVSSITLTATDTSDSDNTCTVEVSIQAKVYEEDDRKSPNIGEEEVIFYYFAPTAEKVNIKGDMTSNWTEMPMTFDDETGYWSISLPIPAVGVYGYGFTGDIPNNWDTDPLNPIKTGSNSALVIPGLLDFTVNALIGKETELPTEAAYLKEDGTEETKNITYSLSEDAKEYGDKIELDTENSSITVSSDWSADVSSIDLIAADDANNTAVVTVRILSKEYVEDKDLVSPQPGKGEATFYYFAPTAEKVEIKGEMTGSEWPTVPMTFNDETGYWSIILTMPVGTYEYGFEVDGEWSTDPLNLPPEGRSNSVVTITEASSEVSPIVEGNKVTFIYKDDSAEKVSAAGEFNSWTPNKDMMEKNEETGYWELVLEDVPAGQYEYKFVVGDAGWKNDPLNGNLTSGDDPNNIFWVTGLVNSSADVTRDGKAASLPNTLQFYSIDESTGKGIAADADVTYALSEETTAKEYADAIILTEKTETEAATICLKEDFPEDVTLFTLTASNAEGNTSTVTINVVDAKYTYVFYYYDKDHTVDQSALWIWENNGSSGAEYPFTESEELADGNTWLKASIELSYTDLGIIVKSKGAWDWQSSDLAFNNKDKAETQTLYIMADDSNVYTELPEIVVLADRYVVVEYTRTDSIADWQLYTWNSGYGGEVWVPFEPVEGSTTKGIAKVKIKQGLSSLSYCISQTIDGDVWANKDGNDYLCSVPVDQTVVKIQMEEGKGITYVYPYNTGYEMEPAEKTIHFYYRDDNAFLAGNEGGFASVSVEIAVKDEDGSLKKADDSTMSYDTVEQRYEYDMPDLKSGSYYYRYLLKENEDSEGTYVIDYFNENKETIDGIEYSVCTYEYYDVAIRASLQNDSMDYNDNNVLTLSLTAKDSSGAEVDASELVSGATVDTVWAVV